MNELHQKMNEIAERTKAAIEQHARAILREVDRHVASVNALVADAAPANDSTQRLLEGFQKQMAELHDAAATAMLEKSKELLTVFPVNANSSSNQSPAPATAHPSN